MGNMHPVVTPSKLEAKNQHAFITNVKIPFLVKVVDDVILVQCPFNTLRLY